MKWICKGAAGAILTLFCFFYLPASWAATVTDSTGSTLAFDHPPTRVVSLVPSLTEALFVMGAGEQVVGVTLHDTWPPAANTKTVVGGFFKPSVDKVLTLNPDLVFASGIQKEVMDALSGHIPVVRLDPGSVEEAFEQIRLMGRIMGCEAGAEKIVTDNRRILADIQKKMAAIPPAKRKRVLRLMGRTSIMTPGADSFQQELIKLAGGIPHGIKRDGAVISLTDGEFLAFNPDVIYGCGGDKKAAELLFANPAFGSVPAVKNNRIDYYPCELTCRASTHVGYFVSWLASNLYSAEFSLRKNQIHPDAVNDRIPVPLDLKYVKKATLNHAILYDFSSKSLEVAFTSPKTILSTLDGWQENISTVGNNYMPPQCWRLAHEGGFEGMKQDIFAMLGVKGETTSFLFTGADMDNFSKKTASFRDMSVTVLATAGVCSNAMRMGKDTGSYYEPGTINILILPNMHLSRRAMSRAVISATEGKTAALQDLDVRSSYTPLVNSATGTGTDNILIAEGEGVSVDNAGGHTKMGELIATAVYEAVTEAIFKQNGLTPHRSVFRRLKDRQLTVSDLVGDSSCPCNTTSGGTGTPAYAKLETLLLEPRYAAFLETAMALSDAWERGLVTDLSAYTGWCNEMAKEIAGGQVPDRSFTGDTDLPKPLGLAVDALLKGIEYKK
ncbi:helical backbone metal receptor [Desulfoluna spongiiphila]|uniref:ABC-type Fe3+-hydroxamate transport system, substrate-binding protein n=1 Tax=Desulfoluna spongiiphila TaxID=419481 RepID=A0A1G5FEM6_9BACT|nr:helical backbone metal receptor [Desulfoluna spongiiphila]SCY37594.1 ABC-type Fe3+-hydroxamate transport system, substrate-binding protein [Desulfoluna spongiiphila]